jgi:histone H3/H4
MLSKENIPDMTSSLNATTIITRSDDSDGDDRTNTKVVVQPAASILKTQEGHSSATTPIAISNATTDPLGTTSTSHDSTIPVTNRIVNETDEASQQQQQQNIDINEAAGDPVKVVREAENPATHDTGSVMTSDSKYDTKNGKKDPNLNQNTDGSTNNNTTIDRNTTSVSPQKRKQQHTSNGTHAKSTTSPSNEKEKSHEETAPPVIDLQRPVKRARTAYFLYLDDCRNSIQKEVRLYTPSYIRFVLFVRKDTIFRMCLLTHSILSLCFLVQNPGVNVATMAKILGQRWSAMSDDEKQPYQDRAALERERVHTATEAWKRAAMAAGRNVSVDLNTSHPSNPNNTTTTNSNGISSMILPVGRVRKICKLDPDVRGISKEAILLITKMTELFTVQLGKECIQTAHIQNRRTLLPQDVVDVCNVRESFFFLKDDVTDLHRQQVKVKQSVQQQQQRDKGHVSAAPKTTKASQRSSNNNVTSSTVASASSKPLTDYFKPVA